MGSTHAQEFGDAVSRGEITLRAALHSHLYTNHYPPLPRGSINIAVQAIEEANRGAFGVKIDISEVGRHRQHGTQVPVRELVEAWHLQPFIDWGDEHE